MFGVSFKFVNIVNEAELKQQKKKEERKTRKGNGNRGIDIGVQTQLGIYVSDFLKDVFLDLDLILE